MKDLCNRLSEGTGLTFKINDDTGEPAASGAALNYWVTTWKDGFTLEANSIYDNVFAGPIKTETDLIKKITELENDFRHV